MTVPAKDIVRIVDGLLKFPFPQICRHSVALDLLSLLKENGIDVSEELAVAVIKADDDTALSLIEDLK